MIYNQQLHERRIEQIAKGTFKAIILGEFLNLVKMKNKFIAKASLLFQSNIENEVLRSHLLALTLDSFITFKEQLGIFYDLVRPHLKDKTSTKDLNLLDRAVKLITEHNIMDINFIDEFMKIFGEILYKAGLISLEDEIEYIMTS